LEPNLKLSVCVASSLTCDKRASSEVLSSTPLPHPSFNSTIFPSPQSPLQGETISPERLKAAARLIEPWLLFALVWSVLDTCDGDSRKKFGHYLRERISEEKVSYATSLYVLSYQAPFLPPPHLLPYPRCLCGWCMSVHTHTFTHTHTHTHTLTHDTHTHTHTQDTHTACTHTHLIQHI